MSNERLKINLLTRIKSSLGIDTRSDEIKMELDDLRKEQQRVVNKSVITSGKLSIINSVIDSIDKVCELAKDDIEKGFADDLSIEVMSYQFSIERAKKQNVDIYQIVNMQQEQMATLNKNIIQYIDNIFNGITYSYGNTKSIFLLIQEISSNVERLNFSDINLKISCYDDLSEIRKKMINKKLNLSGLHNSYSDANSSLRGEIVRIETSHEKYLADYAAELANQRKKR